MPDILTVYAGAQPDKLAVIDDKGNGDVVQWTYAEFEAQSNRVANALSGLGAGPRTKIIWCGPNSPQVAAVMMATRKIGAVAVPLNYRLTAEEARYVIGHSDAEIAYVDAEYAQLFARLLGELPKLRHVIVVNGAPPDGMLGEELIASGSDQPPPELSDELAAGATMIYTSGTTGKPKGAVRLWRRPGGVARPGQLVRLPARRHLPDLGPAVPQRPERVHGYRPGIRADGRGAAQVRRRRLAAAR